MAIDWKDPEIKDRILAAIIASFSTPINCKEVARIFGPDATYDAIENFLRKPKKKAKELTEEAAARGNAAPTKGAKSPAVKQPRAPRTPKKDKDGVKTGRVTKSTPKKTPVKKELAEDDVPTNDLDNGDAMDDEI